MLHSFDIFIFGDAETERIIIILLSTVIIFPLSIAKNLGMLHNFIALGVFAILYITLVICI